MSAIYPAPRHDVPGHWLVGLGYIAGASGVSLLLYAAPAWVLALTTLGSFAAFILLWHMRFGGRLSYVDPGLLFLFVITLYTVIPLLTFEYFDFNLGGSGDNRLNTITLDQDLIYSVWLCSNLAMASFGGAYLALRKPRMPQLVSGRGWSGALWTGGVGAFSILFLTYMYRQVGDTYADEYLFFQTLPTVVVQLFNVINALLFVCAWGLVAQYMGKGQRVQAALLLLLTLVFFLVITEARAGLVFLTLGFLVAWDHFAKRISPFTLVSAAIVGLSVFLILGLMREGTFSVEDAAGRSEFMAVFVTALDIQQLYIIGSTLDMNANLLLSDLLRLVPQQLLAFEKVDPASWYVTTFYPQYAQAGGGLAFGLVSESILGGGGLAASARGLLLGVLACLALNFLTHRPAMWRTMTYIWLFVSLYLCFRDTTFTLVGRFLFQYGPALLIIVILKQLIAIGPGSAGFHARTAPGVARRGAGFN